MGNPYRDAGENSASDGAEEKPDLSSCTCPRWIARDTEAPFPHHVKCPLGRPMSAAEISAAIAEWNSSCGPGNAALAEAIAWALETHGPLFANQSDRDVLKRCVEMADTLRVYWKNVGMTEVAQACTAIIACMNTFGEDL